MLHSPRLKRRLQRWCPDALSLSPVLSVEDQRSLHFLVLLSQRLRKHHEVSERRMPRVKLQPLEGWAEGRRLPRVKLRRTRLRLQTVQLENCQTRRLPRLEHLSELLQHQARAWDYAVEGASQ